MRLDPTSKLKAEMDFTKFEIAKCLTTRIGAIRRTYRDDWKSDDTKVVQCAVVLYLIDKVGFVLVLILKPPDYNRSKYLSV